jgi:hypothetical protein
LTVARRAYACEAEETKLYKRARLTGDTTINGNRWIGRMECKPHATLLSDQNDTI